MEEKMQSELPNYLIAKEQCSAEMHALVPGSYDPVTVGHMDIIGRAADLFDRVTAAVFVNAEKEYLLTLSQKTELLSCACKGLANVKVTSDVGMLYDFCRQNGIDVIVKGVRNEKDYAYECKMAAYNYEHAGVRTLLLKAREDLAEVSSTFVKSCLLEGKSVAKWLPQGVEEPLFNMLLQQL